MSLIKWNKKRGRVSTETATGAYYEVRNNGDVYEDLGGSFNRVARTGSIDAGKAFVENRTKPSVDEDFPDGFPW